MRKTILPNLLFVSLTAICITLMGVQAFAKEPILTPQGMQKTQIVTIDDKAENYRLIFVGERRFRISPSAKILDYAGNPIPLKFFLVPCKAKITYRLFGDNRDPQVDKIQLQ